MKKRAAPLFLAVLTACALACPALAAEAPSPEATPSVLYPVEVLEYTEGDRAEPRISKTYELSPMDDPALIPTGDFERSGCLYTLLDIVKEDQTETDSKYYTETVTLDSKSKDMEEIMPLLAATCEAVTEDGYTGLLTLDTASIQVEASGYGLRSIDVTRTLTTEAAASLMPFRVQEIQDMGGIYCGVNAVSKNLLICNRKNLLNPHGFILGVSGSGKSFTMKEFITFIALSTNDDIIIIDAEREYGDLVRALRGIVLEISPNSRHHINPLEIARGYGMGENPVALKSELLMSICEQQMGEGQLGAFHKSIIDRCTASVYHDFIKSGGKARQPILSDWRNEIKRQPEREAQELALASELFVEGSLNMFAHETNVDIDSRIIVFDLYEMGDQLKPTALNVTMETIQNRVATNRLAGKYTWVFVDEVYVRPEAA